MREYLAEYAAGTLPATERERVARHLTACAQCRAELAGWRALATALAPPPASRPATGHGPAGGQPPAAADVVRAALTRSALTPVPVPSRRRARQFLPALLRSEIRVVRTSVWVVSALVMGLMAVVAGWIVPGDRTAGQLLSIVVPLVAATGVAGVYGPERDPAFELTAATPTPPRLILLVRVALVLGYDLALAVGVSGLVAAAGFDPGGLAEVVGSWLGPTALLAAAGVLIAVRWGPDAALGAVLGLEVVRVVTASRTVLPWVGRLVDAAWTTSAGTVTAAAALLATAVLLAGRDEPLGRRTATHPA